MLLTGFDSKYLNTLYVDKNLKHHGLIQAFSRTNRILNDTKQAGLILDFKAQQKEVDSAITLFSGEDITKAKQIWLVEPATKVITYYENAFANLADFMQTQGLQAKPEDAFNLKGDTAKINFITLFREVQHYKTQLDQYTDITPEQVAQIENVLPAQELIRFKGAYLETAQQLKESMGNQSTEQTDIEQIEFDFVLFASTIIDYDYIMKLISDYASVPPQKQKMTREQLIGLIASDAKFMDQKHTITEYITSLKTGEPLTEQQVKDGYEHFTTQKQNKLLTDIATTYSIPLQNLTAFIDLTISRYVLDEDALRELFTPLNLNWKDRVQKEVSFMKDLLPVLSEKAKGKNISGISAYTEGIS